MRAKQYLTLMNGMGSISIQKLSLVTKRVCCCTLEKWWIDFLFLFSKRFWQRSGRISAAYCRPIGPTRLWSSRRRSSRRSSSWPFLSLSIPSRTAGWWTRWSRPGLDGPWPAANRPPWNSSSSRRLPRKSVGRDTLSQIVFLFLFFLFFFLAKEEESRYRMSHIYSHEPGDQLLLANGKFPLTNGSLFVHLMNPPASSTTSSSASTTDAKGETTIYGFPLSLYDPTSIPHRLQGPIGVRPWWASRPTTAISSSKGPAALAI